MTYHFSFMAEIRRIDDPGMLLGVLEEVDPLENARPRGPQQVEDATLGWLGEPRRVDRNVHHRQQEVQLQRCAFLGPDLVEKYTK